MDASQSKKVMRHPFTIISTLLIALLSQAQEFQQKEIATEIVSATVFIRGAHVTRYGKSIVPAGKTVITISGLSPFLNSKSISVRAEGAFTVLGVNHKLDYFNELRKNDQVDSLGQEIEKIDVRFLEIQNKIDVLKTKQDLMNSNKNLAGTNGVSIDELMKAVSFFEAETQIIKEHLLGHNLERKRLQEKRVLINRQINDVNADKQLPTSVIEIRVDAKETVKGNFEVSYPVENAGWFPKYDIRVVDVSKPLGLEYKADVYQNTGVDWENVKLRLSTADPNASGVAPELSTWFLNYERNTRFQAFDDIESKKLQFRQDEYRTVTGRITDESGEGLPGANVVIKGSTTGTTTDLDGNYKLLVSGTDELVFSYVGFESQQVQVGGRSKVDIALGGAYELSEVVVMGYGSSGGAPGASSRVYTPKPKAEVITTTTVRNQTSFTFELDAPYSVGSNAEKITVDLRKHQIDADYQYYAVPKLDKDAFLIAQLVDWNQYNLLAGEVNLFFEGTYVGQTILDPKAFSDTLDISLGRDKGISIDRVKLEEFSKRRTLGSSKIDSRGFKIMLRNQKDQEVNLKVFDQIPVSVVNDISIDLIEVTDGSLDEKSGGIVWELSLPSQSQKELQLQYDVKYPKKERVILE